MSTMIVELYDALRKAGVDEQLAKDAARAVLPATTKSDLATKADFAELKGDFAALKADFAELKGDFTGLKGDFAELKADFAELKADFTALKADFTGLKLTTRAEIAELKADLLKWNVGAMAVLTAIFAAIVRLG